MNVAPTRGPVAVVAHFDPQDRFDATFETLLDGLLQVCEQILVVSTSAPAALHPRFDGRVQCRFRPNVGYDFYSYKVGLQHFAADDRVDSLFLVNSSFLVTHRERFVAALQRMQEATHQLDLVSITQSRQMGHHLQSYLLHVSAKAWRSQWFSEWVCAIEPRNSKHDIIVRDEIGLSHNALANGACIGAVFVIGKKDHWLGSYRWAKYLLRQNRSWRVLRPSTLAQYNPVHFLGQSLSQQCGLVKTELVRNNPCQQDLAWLNHPQQVPEAAHIQAFAQRASAFYARTGVGLTELAAAKEGTFPGCRLLASGPLGRPGVKVAVVLHLYYPDLLGEIRSYLRHIGEPFDLFVTTPHEGAVADILDRLADTAATVCVALTQNKGRDIGPFLALQRRQLLDAYEAVLKIHGKRSAYSQAGDLWRQRLFNELLGNPLTVATALRLLRQPACGLVGPHRDYLTHTQYWGANRDTVVRLLSPLVPAGKGEPALGFFAGSMFWFKPQAIGQCAELVERAGLVFELENGKQDGTLAHAVERIFCTLAGINGLRATTIELEGASVSQLDASTHSTPVIRHLT